MYDRNDYLAEKRRALDAWGKWIEDVAAGRQLVTNVTALRPAS